MTHRASQWRPGLRGVCTQQSGVAPSGALADARPSHLSLLAGLIAGSLAVQSGAHAADATTLRARQHPSGVVMMIGGMTSEGDAVARPARAAYAGSVTTPAESVAAADYSGPVSIVIQPGSSSLANGAQQTSASAVSRVMALSRMINEAAHAAEVDSALLMAVIDVESGGNPQAVSPKGATGLMQLMPGTGARHGASDLFDPRQNIAAGARYLKALIVRFGDLPLVLAAYNAGEGAVQKYGGRIPPYAETMSYVPRVIARYQWYRDAVSPTGAATVQPVSGSAPERFLLVRPGAGN